MELKAVAAEMVRDLERKWGLTGLHEVVRIDLGPRLRHALGRCYPERGLIRIAPELLRAPRPLFSEVICHEVAHVAVFERHGRTRRPHGREWQQLMQTAGFAPRVRIPIDELPASVLRGAAPAVLYEHRCPVCHASRVARRAMPRWRCAACVRAGLGGELTVVSRPLEPARP